MAARQPQFSPKQIADALASSESSVKRWCDKGTIPTIRTVGGHRRVTLDGLRQFLQSTGRTLALPEVLGLPRLGVGRKNRIPGGDEPGQVSFREALVNGDEDLCRKLLHQRLDEGWMKSEAAEFLITDAMHGIGEAWDCEEVDAYQERRGCDICIRLINELRMQIAPLRDDAPVAIGGTPAGDPYQLPTALVELALREVGWKATSLGVDLPTESFIQAAHDFQPQMVWLSVSTIMDVPRFITDQIRMANGVGEDVPVLIGGRALTDEVRPRLVYTAFCDSLTHLTQLAAMMRSR